MTDVSVRELRNEGGRVLDRVQRGEEVTVTRSGRPVARLLPLRRPMLTTQELKVRMEHLPHIDAQHLLADLDAVVDQGDW